MDPRSAGGVQPAGSGRGVDVTAFSNITGQVIYAKILEAYTQEAFVVSKLVDTIPTRLDGEKIPGIGRVERRGGRGPARACRIRSSASARTTSRRRRPPSAASSCRSRRRRSSSTARTWSCSRAAEVGEVLGLNKEKRLVDLVIGATNNYKWKGTAYNTYYAAGDGGPWINEMAGNELVDWTDVDAAEQLFADILDPEHGRAGAGPARTRCW